ncbi:DUF7507 domain-containing protein, partial [Algoriphagus sp. PAP.12]|uniref:DUF7507 domain-containing protein n=1 Tax=Algoriphagus sp. PAP.12 TaxID=2996678 RepID=UPI002DD4483A
MTGCYVIEPVVVTINNCKIALVKTVAPTDPSDECVEAGDELTYTFVVSNLSNVTLTGVTVTDIANSFTGTGSLSAITFQSSSMSSSVGTLLSGESATYTATYIVTPEDVEAGFVTNQAEAEGTFGQTTVDDKSGSTIDNDIPTTYELCQTESIAITKTVA